MHTRHALDMSGQRMAFGRYAKAEDTYEISSID